MTPAELYDPVACTFTVTGSPTYLYGYNTAALLLSGKVLITGGPAGQSEIYEPLSGTWSATGSLNSTRMSFMVTPLSDGRVLVTDGQLSYQIISAEIYTP